MKRFNLSAWAVSHPTLVLFLMIVLGVAGFFSYEKLGRAEDPFFTVKVVNVSVIWPGATAQEMQTQVADPIEKKIQELPYFEKVQTYSKPAFTALQVTFRDNTPPKDVPYLFYLLRKKLVDVQGQLPSGILGPVVNDEFSDVDSILYMMTGDGADYAQLKKVSEGFRQRLLKVPGVTKVDVYGNQDERIFVEFSHAKLATLGITPQALFDSLAKQNNVTPAGTVETSSQRVPLRVTGALDGAKAVAETPVESNGRVFRLGDIATVTHGYVDPPSFVVRQEGKPAIGIGVVTAKGANILELGKEVEKATNEFMKAVPQGIDVKLIADQPKVVEHAVGEFVHSFMEALVIVLFVSFLALGWRTGIVVAMSVPLVLGIVFIVMNTMSLDLHRITLGALIIALGLLVDDAMIAVEMMVARLEMGDSLRKAATYVYTSTAFPMLTGTLVTVAGFIPIGLNNSAAGEFTFSLFVVIAISLVVSWVVAVIFTPLLGVTILPKSMKKHHEQKGRVARIFARLLDVCMRWKWTTIVLTVLVFGVSVFAMRFVQEQFFPSSDRPELVVDWALPQNASIAETNAQIAKFEEEKLKGNPDIERWSSYIGEGAVRFLLSFDVQPPSPAFGQTVIVSKDLEARDRLQADLQAYLRETFVGTDALVKLLDIGPPVGRPIQYRISGSDIQEVRKHALAFGELLGKNDRLGDIVYDWNEPARVVKVDVLQDKARQLGVTSQDIASTLNGVVGGTTVTQIRDDVYLIDVIGRARSTERESIETLRQIQLPTANGTSVPLAAVANFRYEMEQPVVWRRSRQPTITVKASVTGGVQPATIVSQMAQDVSAFGKNLPSGYHIAVGGAVEESTNSQAPIVAVVPLMLFAMATILMVQLQSFSRLFLVFAVAPLALIGVVIALLGSGAPLGFVAILGVLALIGILIRNSVILVVQIEDLRREGMHAWDAVREATEHRMRPIMLTAAAASLALIPISREVFWGPMAYAMMGGIIVGTVLTLLFLPALYIAWFRIKPQDGQEAMAEPEPAGAA